MRDASDNGSVPPITVRRVNGRFPFHPGPLRSNNITSEVRVSDDGRQIHIRLDSPSDHPDFWMQLLLHCHDPGTVLHLPSQAEPHDD